jgi:hypothetical protein
LGSSDVPRLNTKTSAFFALSIAGYDTSAQPSIFTPAPPGSIRATPAFFVHSP